MQNIPTEAKYLKILTKYQKSNDNECYSIYFQIQPYQVITITHYC